MKCQTKKGADKQKNSNLCQISRTTRRLWKTNGFCDIAQQVLGKRYTISIVLVGDQRARTLNRRFRGKDTAANVLSFPLSETVGEIYLNLARIEREAAQFELTPEGHAKYLLIHGCLHLKGYTHGSTMERAEERLIKVFKLR